MQRAGCLIVVSSKNFSLNSKKQVLYLLYKAISNAKINKPSHPIWVMGDDLKSNKLNDCMKVSFEVY